MGILDGIKDWFTSETARNKNSSLIAGLLVNKYNKNKFNFILTYQIFFVICTNIHCYNKVLQYKYVY